MRYDDDRGGRVRGDASTDGRFAGNANVEHFRALGLLTFDDVQERLVEAMLTCWRHPDRERAWQRIRSWWPDIRRHNANGDYGDTPDGASSAQLRPIAASRRDIAEMEEAFGWVDALSTEDRKLVGLAVSILARGRREISWSRLLAPMGMTRGAGGLRRRYERAIASICAAQNGGNPRDFASTPEIDAE